MIVAALTPFSGREFVFWCSLIGAAATWAVSQVAAAARHRALSEERDAESIGSEA